MGEDERADPPLVPQPHLLSTRLLLVKGDVVGVVSVAGVAKLHEDRRAELGGLVEPDAKGRLDVVGAKSVAVLRTGDDELSGSIAVVRV